MPIRAPRVCSCGLTVASGAVCICVQKRKREHDAGRPSASQRGYDAAWKRTRADFLKRNPVCCKIGCDKPATDADHIVSVRERPDLRLSWSNLRPFCHSHHSQRTARDQAFGRTQTRGEGPDFGSSAGDRRSTTAHDRDEFNFTGF